jgi:glycosyltransferase involved in cell wall biosynthesis
MARARGRKIAVVFALHNFEYRDARLFQHTNAVLVPSQFCAEHYQRTLGLRCTAIPSPLNWSRVRCERSEARQYVTFVNPQPNKGVFVFVRIAHELGRRRPDIPLLIVEGRGGVNWLTRTGLDLSGLENMNAMANTPDPRDFYCVSRVVLMPSLWRESFGRVAAEALLNGIPVLASRRGALPEVLREAGFLFDVPERYTPESRVVPTAEEVAPWVETVIRLWDDAAFYEQESRGSVAAAEAWRPERLVAQYDAFFRGLLGS